MNIAKHAGAKNVFVVFKCDRDAVYVNLEDDGTGFDMSSLFLQAPEARDRRGLGILGMKERALLIGGNMEICSQPGIGTKIDIRIPLKQTEDICFIK